MKLSDKIFATAILVVVFVGATLAMRGMPSATQLMAEEITRVMADCDAAEKVGKKISRDSRNDPREDPCGYLRTLPQVPKG